MSLALALVINVTAALALIGGLAFAMSRASLLTPQSSSRCRATLRLGGDVMALIARVARDAGSEL